MRRWVMCLMSFAAACSQPGGSGTSSSSSSSSSSSGSMPGDAGGQTNTAVRVLLLLDASGSWQLTDPDNTRVTAVRALLDAHAGNTALQFSVIQYNSLIYQFPDDGTFANPPLVTDAQLGLTELTSDWQGALGRAHQTLTEELARAGSGAATTRYVVIFIADGQAGPMCCVCADETTTASGSGRFTCNGNGDPEPPAPSTTIDGVEFEERFCEGHRELPLCNDHTLVPDRLDAYRELEINGNFNRSSAIDARVQDLVSLTSGTGGFALHTLFYNPPVPDAGALLGVDAPWARARLQSMAALGHGQFTEVTAQGGISLTGIDLSP